MMTRHKNPGPQTAGTDVATLSSKESLASQIGEALREGQTGAAGELLTAADELFPGDSQFRTLHTKRRKQVERFAHLEAGLSEVEHALEECRFVQALGAFREAVNLSRGFDQWGTKVFNTGVEAAEQLTERNWRIALSLLNEATQLDASYVVPDEAWQRIELEQREEEIKSVLSKAKSAQLSGNLKQAQWWLAQALEKYPGEERLLFGAQSNAYLEEKRRSDDRQNRLEKLIGLRDQLAVSDDPEAYRNIIPRAELTAGMYAFEAQFAAILQDLGARKEAFEARPREVAAVPEQLIPEVFSPEVLSADEHVELPAAVALSPVQAEHVQIAPAQPSRWNMVALAATLVIVGAGAWTLRRYQATGVRPPETVQTAVPTSALPGRFVNLPMTALNLPPKMQAPSKPAVLQIPQAAAPVIPLPAAPQVNTQQLEWDGVDKNNPEALQAFLAKSDSGPFSAQARELLANNLRVRTNQAEQSDWDASDKVNPDALRGYLAKYPAGPHASAAQQALADIDQQAQRRAAVESSEETAWNAVKTSDRGSLEAFNRQFPASAHHGQAEQALFNLSATESTGKESEAILTVLQRYQNAWRAKDMDTILVLQRNLDRRGLKALLAPVREVVMTVSPESAPRIEGVKATVLCRRQANEVFSDGTAKKSPEALVTFSLTKLNGAWTIEGIGAAH